jgi:REP element-mobilizing transposase RayT
MRLPRIKSSPDAGNAYYHCLSRVVDRRFIFGDAEREQFVHWLFAYAEFCGVRVLTYCVMSNHFHVLLEVGRRPEQRPDDEELLRRIARIHGERSAARVRTEMACWPDQQKEEWRQSLLGQMWDVSTYMKHLKQRFTQWYNRRAARKGTLWEERFKSLMVQGQRGALAKVAAYIDLNPIRARIVDDPKDYRWCGYAAAVAGKRAARDGVTTLLNTGQGRDVTATEALRLYRLWIFGEGQVEGVEGPGSEPIRAGFSREQVETVIAQQGRLPWSEFVRCRVRYFTDGAAIGSKDWIQGVLAEHQARFDYKRERSPCAVRQMSGEALFGAKPLRKGAVFIAA